MCSSDLWRPFVEGLEFDQIDESERDWLERRFEKEEILLAFKFFYRCHNVIIMK